MSVERKRLITAAVALVLGLAFCFVMYWWQLRYAYAYHGMGLNLFMSIPFAVLAGMVFGGMSRGATILGWIALAVMTAAAYVSAATNSNSTAVIVYVLPLFYGAIVLSIVFAVDSILRRSKFWKRWRQDERRD